MGLGDVPPYRQPKICYLWEARRLLKVPEVSRSIDGFDSFHLVGARILRLISDQVVNSRLTLNTEQYIVGL